MSDPSEDQDEGRGESTGWSRIETAELGPELGLPSLLDVIVNTQD